jgi:hypothetical protein
VGANPVAAQRTRGPQKGQLELVANPFHEHLAGFVRQSTLLLANKPNCAGMCCFVNGQATLVRAMKSALRAQKAILLHLHVENSEAIFI